MPKVYAVIWSMPRVLVPSLRFSESFSALSAFAEVHAIARHVGDPTQMGHFSRLTL
jgi:hypothetical protein